MSFLLPLGILRVEHASFSLGFRVKPESKSLTVCKSLKNKDNTSLCFEIAGKRGPEEVVAQARKLVRLALTIILLIPAVPCVFTFSVSKVRFSDVLKRGFSNRSECFLAPGAPGEVEGRLREGW